MKLVSQSFAVVAILAVGCAARQGAGQREADFRYLGIPSEQEYPQTAFQLDDRVPRKKYYRVSRVQHVTKEDYERDVARGRMQFRERHAGAEYYATEFSGDFDQQPGVRAWVTILQRKVYP